MTQDEYEHIWDQTLQALESGNEELAISLSKRLSGLGDWRGSSALGYIFEKKARKFPTVENDLVKKHYSTAAGWYELALRQGDNPASHYGLAAYYYYGLGGISDFKKAFTHLQHAIEHIPVAKIMLAELYMMGVGTNKDAEMARSLLKSASDDGYPAAYVSLYRLEKYNKKYLRAIYYYSIGLYKAIRLFIDNKNHQLLAGIGPNRRTFQIAK